jgi:hypothetical protein
MSIEQFSDYIYKINGFDGVKFSYKEKDWYGFDFPKNGGKMKIEKLLGLSIIINVILSLIVVLSFIAFDSFFAYAAYGYFN